MTTTLSSLEQLLSEAIGDYLSFDTSSNITTGSTGKIVATTLANYDGNANDYFNDWWAYITEGNNSGKNKRVFDYLTTANTLKVRGGALAAESSAVTVSLHKFDRRNKIKALNRAIEQLYPSLYKKLDNLTLITGNIMPDASFEWWTSASAHKFLSTSNATLAKTTTAGLYRGNRGQTSMKVTAGAANGYAYISSNTYPRLLDLMDNTVDFYCWAYPSVANDAAIVIYTIQADGTAQTLTSTTTCPATKWTKLELEDQDINDDIVEIQIRFKVVTNAANCYFDDCIVCGKYLREYLLPEDFQDGHVSQVHIQTEGYSDEPAYDINPREWEKAEFDIIHDGTYKYIQLKDYYEIYNRMRLIGYTPLETLTADTDTISLDGEKLNLIIAQAAYNLYQMERGTVAAEVKSRYNEEMAYWAAMVREYKSTLTMIRPADYLRTR